MNFNPLLMLHEIPAQFLRMKIAKNFCSAVPLVLLKMPLMGEQNWFYFFPLLSVKAVSFFILLTCLLSFSLYPLSSPVSATALVYVRWYWWGKHRAPRMPTSLSSSTIKGSYKATWIQKSQWHSSDCVGHTRLLWCSGHPQGSWGDK